MTVEASCVVLSKPSKHPRLLLPQREGSIWRVAHQGPNLHDVEIDEHVLLRVRTLVAPSAEHTMWIEGILREGAPAGAQLQRVSEESLCSATGLPLIFAHARILTADGQLFEERAGAFYAVLHNRAEVVAHLRGGATWSSYSAQLKSYMLSAQIEWPDFTDDLLVTQLGIPL